VRWKNEGSFGFAKRWHLCRAKTNVPECAVGFLFLFCLFPMNANVWRLEKLGI